MTSTGARKDTLPIAELMAMSAARALDVRAKLLALPAKLRECGNAAERDADIRDTIAELSPIKR